METKYKMYRGVRFMKSTFVKAKADYYIENDPHQIKRTKGLKKEFGRGLEEIEKTNKKKVSKTK